MAGYTRQSVAEILNGLDITAPPINAEFNQLESAFNGTTGHSHDGTSGNGPKINLATSISGYLPAVNGGTGTRNNPTATTDPAVSNDSASGYGPGSIWVNTSGLRTYICLDGTPGSATWAYLFVQGVGDHMYPRLTASTDLGTDSLRFRDLFISRDAILGRDLIVGGSSTITGTLGVTGAATFGTLNATAVNIDGGNIDETPIGVFVASTVRGTTVTALTGFVGDVTGDLLGNVTGNLTGNVTGDLTGNVSSSGTSDFNIVNITGTLDMSSGTSATVTGLSAPINPTDAATKSYVDSGISALVDVAPAALDTLNELAAALGDDPNFATTVTNNLATKLPLAGGTMSGAIAMGTSKITGLGNPTLVQDAATKSYVDTADALKLNLSGGTMSGILVMDGSRITTLGTPVAGTDATTKTYVDNILISGEDATASAAAALVSENNAAASEAAAANSETNSATSETNASASAAAALVSENNAAASEAAAALSESNASASETASALSETNAATSETNAQTAETNAETAQAAAEVALAGIQEPLLQMATAFTNSQERFISEHAYA